MEEADFAKNLREKLFPKPKTEPVSSKQANGGENEEGWPLFVGFIYNFTGDRDVLKFCRIP